MTDAEVLRRFNVTVMGQGQPTLVFAHGFGSDQTAWRYQVEAFAAQYRIVLFDHLGCGKADVSDYHPRRYNSLARYAEDLLQIYAALNLSDTIYVGHSISAMIGMLASLARPSAFSKFVFVGASPRYLNDEAYIGGFTQADLEQIYALMAEDYLGWTNGFAPLAMGNPERPELGHEFTRTLSTMRADIAQSVARVIFESDVRAQLPALQAPVLVLQAANDPMVPPQAANYLACHLPHNQLHILHAQGHLPHLSAPAQVTAAMHNFLGTEGS